MLYHKTNKKAIAVLCSAIKHLSDESTQEVGRISRVPPYFFCALVPSLRAYNRTKHSYGFFIC